MRLWAILQGLVAVAMAGSIFVTVTGFLPWLVMNMAAGISGAVAALAWKSRTVTLRAAVAAAVLFVPFNLAVALGNLVSGRVDAVPAALLAIALAQLALTITVVRSPAQSF